MQTLLTLFVDTIALLITGYVLQAGVTISDFWSAVIVVLVLGIVNMVIKPILVILTLPLNIITLGLFTFVINALVILLVDYLVPGFAVQSFGWALLFSIVLSIVNAVLHRLTK